MIIVMKGSVVADAPEVERVVRAASAHDDISAEVRSITGATRAVTEVYLLGPTETLSTATFEAMAGVERVMRIRQRYRAIGRHEQAESFGFKYNGLEFSQETFHVFAGLCAVDNPDNVETMFKALQAAGLNTTRAGAYKPRTSPYDFQGHGAECLPYVFELAGKHDIRVVAMEVTRPKHVDEILDALHQAGNATGVMLQIGTRNAQNFELLKAVGQQTELPVLFKRGMGITLEESLNACEYVASGGNQKIVFCLRGVKSHLGDPHRNLVDFAHVPAVRRLTRLPVCIDPSHSVGKRAMAPDGLSDVFHVAAQGVIAGANMVLIDFHPRPEQALCDGPQALRLDELQPFLDDMQIVREAYLRRLSR